MKEYGLTVLVAATVTYLLTPLVRKFAIWFGAWHEPRERDVHTEPVPELGGLAIFCGVAAALLVASRMFPLSGVFAGTRVGSGLLLAGGVVVLIGVVDDRWGLGALTKLVGQIGAGAILVWSGAVVGWLPLPGGGTLALTPDQQTVLTILIVVMTINAVNFIDGLDGLATGIVGIGAAAFYLYYYTLAKRLGLSEQTDPALASAVLAGVCLGFLPHNFHPARIFLGDTGAMLLGLLLAYVPISSLASLDPNTLTTPSAYSGGTVNRFPEILPLLLPATILLIPYVDLLLAVVRRTRAGLSPWHADKKHLHHRLLDIGHSHRTSVLIMYLWATLFAGTVVLLSIIRTKLPVLGVVTLAGFLVLLWLTMPRLRPWARRSAPRADASRGQPGARRRARQPCAGQAGRRGGARWLGRAGWLCGDRVRPARLLRRSGQHHVRLATTLRLVRRYRPPDSGGRRPGRAERRDGRSAAGLSGRTQVGPGRPGQHGAGRLDPGRAGYAENGQPSSGYAENGQLDSGYTGNGQRDGGHPDDGYPTGGQAGDGYPAGGQAGNGFPGGSPAEAGYPGGYPAGPAAPGEAAPPMTGEARPSRTVLGRPGRVTLGRGSRIALGRARGVALGRAGPSRGGRRGGQSRGRPSQRRLGRRTPSSRPGRPPGLARRAPRGEEPLLPWRFGLTGRRFAGFRRTCSAMRSHVTFITGGTLVKPRPRSL